MRDTLDNRMRNVNHSTTGESFPCANCFREVPAAKALKGVDHVFCTRSCSDKFLKLPEVSPLTDGQKKNLFTWYRDIVVDTWTQEEGHGNPLFSKRQRDKQWKRLEKKRINPDALPVGAPAFWMDFLLAKDADINQPDHVFTHDEVLLHLKRISMLSFTPQKEPAEELSASNGSFSKNGAASERALDCAKAIA